MWQNNMKKQINFIALVVPIIAILLGILINISNFSGNKVGFFNFIYSTIYCILWGILFYYAPKAKSRVVHMSYLIWWFVSLYLGITGVFSHFITINNGITIGLIPYLIFITPLSGFRFLFNYNFDYASAIICFIFFIVALCEAFIFHAFTAKKEDAN